MGKNGKLLEDNINSPFISDAVVVSSISRINKPQKRRGTEVKITSAYQKDDPFFLALSENRRDDTLRRLYT